MEFVWSLSLELLIGVITLKSLLFPEVDVIGGSGAASILEVVYTLGGPEEDCSDKLSCWLLGESIVSFLLPTPSSPSLFFAQLPLFLLQGERD